jgi:hypothetical protein
MREPDQEHTGFNSVGSPFSSLCPTNRQYSIVTSREEEREMILPALTGDEQLWNEQLAAERGKSEPKERMQLSTDEILWNCEEVNEISIKLFIMLSAIEKQF